LFSHCVCFFLPISVEEEDDERPDEKMPRAKNGKGRDSLVSLDDRDQSYAEGAVRETYQSEGGNDDDQQRGSGVFRKSQKRRSQRPADQHAFRRPKGRTRMGLFTKYDLVFLYIPLLLSFSFRQLKHKEEPKQSAPRDSDLHGSSAKFHHNTTGDEDDEYPDDEERGTALVTTTLNRTQTMEVDMNSPPPPVIAMPGSNKNRRKSSMFGYLFGGDETPGDSDQGTEASTPAIRYKVQGNRILDVDLDVIPDGKI
jgi:hypothetical protein